MGFGNYGEIELGVPAFKVKGDLKMNDSTVVAGDVTAMAFNSLQMNYTKAGGNVSAIPPGIWTTLLQIAMQVLNSFLGGSAGGLCPAPTPAGAIAAGKSKSPGAVLFVRRQVATQMREDYGLGSYIKYGGDHMVTSILDTAGGATEEQITQLAALPSK